MILIRIAAVIALIQGLAHGALFVLAKVGRRPNEAMVVDTMKAYVFNFGGARHSYWDMYFGYGLLAAGVCLVEAALLWLLAPWARSDPARLAWIVGLLVLANFAHAAVILRFFFYLPLVADALVVLALAAALIGLLRAARAPL